MNRLSPAVAARAAPEEVEVPAEVGLAAEGEDGPVAAVVAAADTLAVEAAVAPAPSSTTPYILLPTN